MKRFVFKYQKLIKKKNNFLQLFLVIIMLAVAGNYVKVFQKDANPSTASLQSSTIPHYSYTSDKLGISFTYISEVSGVQRFFTREIDDKVYLYYNFDKSSFNRPFPGIDSEFLTLVAPGAKYVQVFSKNPNQSLISAVKQQFLTGYSDSNCIVHETKHGQSRQDNSFQTAVIDVPHNKSQKREQVDAAISRCPIYTTGFGVNYFMMDPKHPSKLLFVKLGQDNIPSGSDGYTWDGTIKVY